MASQVFFVVVKVRYSKLLDLLEDMKMPRCIKCKGPLEFYKVHVENFMKPNEEVYVTMLCFKCKLEYLFKYLGLGVIGLKKMREINSSSLEEYLKSVGEAAE